MRIMLMTGMTDPAIRREVEAAGAQAFFYKPIEMDEFLGAVRRSLGAAPGSEPEAQAPASAAGQEKPLAVVDRLEDLRRKAVMGMAAILHMNGQVIAQAGFLTGVYEQPGLAIGLANLYASGVQVSQTLRRADPETQFYVAGKDQHFLIVSVNSEHLLVLTAEQPFQNQIEALGGWLPDFVRELDRLLSGRPLSQALPQVEALVGEAETPPEEEAPFRSLEEELAGVEVSAEDRAAIDAMFSQADLQKVKKTNLDDFWDNLAEESGSVNTDEGSISYDQARDLGLAPE
jgi:predicted regulator of Ras-like GTPase activity (Roadblock/LC7/MglB family)